MMKNNRNFFKLNERCILEDSESSLNSFKQNKIIVDNNESNDQQFLGLIKINKNKKISKIKKLNNSLFENLLDELESLKEFRLKIDNKDYASEEIKKIKQKLAHLIFKKSFYSFVKNDFELNDKVINNVFNFFENDVTLRQFNNKFKNELLIKTIFNCFNSMYKIKINNLIMDFDPNKNEQLYFNLIYLKKKILSIDILLKNNFNIFNQKLDNYFSVLIDKEILKLRIFSNEYDLFKKTRLQLVNQRLGNMSLLNKLNSLSKRIDKLK